MRDRVEMLRILQELDKDPAGNSTFFEDDEYDPFLDHQLSLLNQMGYIDRAGGHAWMTLQGYDFIECVIRRTPIPTHHYRSEDLELWISALATLNDRMALANQDIPKK